MTIFPGTNTVTSPFCWRTNSKSTAWTRHNGIDLKAAKGEAQRYVANQGKCIFSGWATSAWGVDKGRMVAIRVLDFTEDVVFIYQHLSATGVSVGQMITLGQTVGLTGGSGSNKKENAYSPHCHFEVRVNNIPVYPAAYANIENEKASFPSNNLPPVYNVPPLTLERQHPAQPTLKASSYSPYSRHPGYQNLGAAPYTKEDTDMSVFLKLSMKEQGKNNQIFKEPDNYGELMVDRADNGLYLVVEAPVPGATVFDTLWAKIKYGTQTGYISYGGMVNDRSTLLTADQAAAEYGSPLQLGGASNTELESLKEQLSVANANLVAMSAAKTQAENTAKLATEAQKSAEALADGYWNEKKALEDKVKAFKSAHNVIMGV